VLSVALQEEFSFSETGAMELTSMLEETIFAPDSIKVERLIE